MKVVLVVGFEVKWLKAMSYVEISQLVSGSGADDEDTLSYSLIMR